METAQGRVFETLSKRVIGCAIEVHRVLGPGLLESAYERALAHELKRAGIRFRAQFPVTVEYKGINLKSGYRIDLLIEDQLILELKSVENLLPLHTAQLLTYLKLSPYRYGLLINFNASPLKNGIKRLVK